MGDSVGDSITDTEGQLDTGRVIAPAAVDSPDAAAFEAVELLNVTFRLVGSFVEYSFLIVVLAFLFLGKESFETLAGGAVGGGVFNSGDNSMSISLPYPARCSISMGMLGCENAGFCRHNCVLGRAW